MAILLIGSTGNGKSTLGNFLIDPDSKLPPNERFAVSRNNMPTTEVCQVESTTIELDGQKMKDIMVIDTPGLNENNTNDLWHMINLIERLQKVKKIRACVFVVKFSTQLDAQYKATVQYYASLLPDLFANNVVIAVTNYLTDTRSEERRKKQGTDVHDIASNIKTTVVEYAALSFDPILFMLDCDPIGEKEVKTSKSVRKGLLQYIFSLQETEVNDFTVAKTKALLDDDNSRINTYEGQIKGYKDRLEQAHKKVQLDLNKVETQEKTVIQLVSQLSVLQSNIDELDTDNLVTAAVYSVDDTWKFLKRLTKIFEVESKHQIHSYSTWTNGQSKFEDVKQELYKVTGRIEGRFMRGLYANVTVYTKKKWAHAKEIDQLKKDILQKEREWKLEEEKAKTIRDSYDMHKEQVAEFKGYIDEIKKTISRLKLQRLSLEEARKRLIELRQKE